MPLAVEQPPSIATTARAMAAEVNLHLIGTDLPVSDRPSTIF